ncbi:MAG: riboflavin synthase, partial [Pseudomonadota bacterium]
MFTGIIQAVGHIRQTHPVGGDVRVEVATGALDLSDVALGDSIACNGICLTVTSCLPTGFTADVSRETLEFTTLGSLSVNSALNLEKALRAQDRLGGHIVSGHVDGVAEIVEITPDGRAQRFRLQAPPTLSKYISHKGSVTIDGVSLTVNSVDGHCFDLCIVPHTLSETIFPEYQVGSKVNIEVDVIARYVERLLTA